MEALGFLGGKYQEPELIVPGQVQTLRATDTATGKFVFAHRVSMTEEPAEQAALLRLLTTGLMRSPEVKKLVLDFGEEEAFWYVVTQPEPQCILLRQWLQKQLGETEAPPKRQVSKPATQEPLPPIEPRKPTHTEPPVKPMPPPPPKSELGPGEFTRLFQKPAPLTEKLASPVAPPSAGQRNIEQPKVPTANSVEPKSEPGDFTRLFQTAARTPPSPSVPSSQPPSPAPPTKPSQAEPGEFTRFFQGGLPPSAKPLPKESQSSNGGQERPSRGGFVQRPNTPMPPPAQKPADSGEFTRLFSRPAPESAKPVTPLPDLSNQSAGSTSFGAPDVGGGMRQPSLDLFTAERSKSPTERPGEYTKIFGSGNTARSPQQPTTTAEPSPPPLVDDPVPGTRIFSSAPAPPPATPKSPSEYTMVLQGKAAAEPASPVSGSAPAPSGKAKPSSNLTAPPPVAFTAPAAPRPQIPQPPADAAKLASAAAPVAAGSNKKLTILLIVLGVLAIALVVLVALVFKK